MPVIKATTVALATYNRLCDVERKYKLIIQAITNDYMSNLEKIKRIDDITEDHYVFQKGE